MGRHIFIHCHHFSEMHEQAARDFCSATFRLSEVETTPLTMEVYLHSARHLFNDDSSVGPQTLSHFYLGRIPLVASSESSPPASHPRRIANTLYPFTRGKYKHDSHPYRSPSRSISLLPKFLIISVLVVCFLFLYCGPYLCGLTRYFYLFITELS